eukprot:2705526-Pyramimonas_sp.AAC.2
MENARLARHPTGIGVGSPPYTTLSASRVGSPPYRLACISGALEMAWLEGWGERGRRGRREKE